jgi:hypothetical protein
MSKLEREERARCSRHPASEQRHTTTMCRSKCRGACVGGMLLLFTHQQLAVVDPLEVRVLY